VRLSGSLSIAIAKKLTNRSSFKPRYATLCNIYTNNNEIIDEAIVIYFKAPYSFTCEDVIEFQCHGGIMVSSMILDECLKEGARASEAGEFTKRAVLNGRIDLTRAEAAAKLIESKSIDSAKILSRQLKGELQQFVDKLRNDLVEILAFIEVNIDYAEEDLPLDLLTQINDRLTNIKILLENTLETSKSREGLIDGFKVSIIGKPNVGKSSLLNALLKYDRAIISPIAGTTRDTIEESLKIGTHLVKFVDTAGIRDAHESIEKIGIEKSIEAIEEADIVIALFDGSQKIDQDDEKIIKLLENYKSSKKIIVAINKSDLEKKIISKELDASEIIEISCKENIQAIKDTISSLLYYESLADDLILISKRQIDEVTGALNYIDESFSFLKDGELELFAFNINESIKHIASITIGFERSEILDKMFGSFCLGK